MGLENKTVRDYLLLLLFTGLRKNEVAELLWENVDLTRSTLLIPDPKNRQPYMLPLTPFLEEMLTKQWDGRENEYVFPGQGEKYRYIRDVRHHMDLVTESSKVTFMLHDLRRTFLTIADAQDLSRRMPSKSSPITRWLLTSRLATLSPTSSDFAIR